MKIICLIIILLLIKNIISFENHLNIIDDPSSEKWNFDEIDKLFIDEYKEVKKIGKIEIVYHFNQTNKTRTEIEMDFKLNNGLVLSFGNYLTIDDNDQKLLLSLFQPSEINKTNLGNNNFENIGKNWFSVHFIGESNGLNKTISWISNSQTKSVLCNSLQQLFLKYIKRFNEILSNHQSSVTVVKYNSNGAYCISGSQDKTLKLWNPNKGSMIHSFEEHGYGINDFCTTLDNKQLFSCAEKQVYQWDIANGSVIRRFQNTHNDTVTCVCVNNDSTLLFTGSNDKLVKVWDLRSNSVNPVQVLDDAKDSITSIITNETTQNIDLGNHGHSHGHGHGHGHSHGPAQHSFIQKEVITSSVDGSIRQYDVRMGTLATYDDTIPVSSVSITKNKKCFIASCTDETVKLIDIDTYDTLKEYKSHQNSTYKINSCSNYNDTLIISGSEDNNFYIWELSTSKLLHKLSGHTNVITHVNAHPTKNQFITSSADCTIRVWSNQE